MTPQPGQDTPEAASPCGAEDVVQSAKEDLAERLGLSTSEVLVVSIEAVDWPDTSLGCPQPGMAYAQVITPGYQIVLKAKGPTHEYHTDRHSQVMLCHPDAENQPPSPKGIDDSSPWQPVEPIEPDEIHPSPEA
jgi:hypothetical protein